MATHLAGIVIERARAVEQLGVAKTAAEQRAQEIEERDREIRQKNEQMETDLRMATELQQALMPAHIRLFRQTPPRGARGFAFVTVICRRPRWAAISFMSHGLTKIRPPFVFAM